MEIIEKIIRIIFYNYYLNAPMRGDISEDFKYPPRYYYKPKLNGPDPGKVFTNLI